MKWKNAARKLPKEGSTVLGYWGEFGQKGTYGVATYARPGHWHEPENDDDDFREPEYWMDLPPSPYEESK